MKVFALLLLVCADVNAQRVPCQQQGFEPGDDGYCYKVVRERRDFYAAAQECAAMSARLPVVQNSFQNAVIMGIVQKDSQVWLGLSKFNVAGQRQDSWRWDSPITNFTKIPTSYPPCSGFNCYPHDGTIATLLPSGSWTDANPQDNEEMTKFICQMANNNAGPCYSQVESSWPYNQNPSNKKCYSIIDSEQLNNEQGASFCAAANAHLPTIQSQQENDFLLGQFCWQCNLNFTEIAWTGLMFNNGKYTWSDGTPFDPKTSYTNFRAAPSTGNCVVMNFPSGQWSYTDCDRTNANTFCMRNSATN